MKKTILTLLIATTALHAENNFSGAYGGINVGHKWETASRDITKEVEGDPKVNPKAGKTYSLGKANNKHKGAVISPYLGYGANSQKFYYGGEVCFHIPMSKKQTGMFLTYKKTHERGLKNIQLKV